MFAGIALFALLLLFITHQLHTRPVSPARNRGRIRHPEFDSFIRARGDPVGRSLRAGRSDFQNVRLMCEEVANSTVADAEFGGDLVQHVIIL
jgi:hypothetical protein